MALVSLWTPGYARAEAPWSHPQMAFAWPELHWVPWERHCFLSCFSASVQVSTLASWTSPNAASMPQESTTCVLPQVPRRWRSPHRRAVLHFQAMMLVTIQVALPARRQLPPRRQLPQQFPLHWVPSVDLRRAHFARSWSFAAVDSASVVSASSHEDCVDAVHWLSSTLVEILAWVTTE